MQKYRYRKSYNTKKKISILKSKFFWFAILFFIVLGSIFYFFFLSSVFQIKEIKISGNQKISTQEIKDIIEEKINKKKLLFISRNFFLIDIQEAKTIIEEFPAASKVILKRKFPNKVIVNVEERTPVGIWCQSDENCYYIDKEGVIFEKTKDKRELVINSEREIIFGQRIIEKESLKDILEIHNELKDIELDVRDFNILDQGEKLVADMDRWEIYFNLLENVSDQLFNLKLLLKEKIPPEQRENLEYIDLRFGSRIFYRNKQIILD